MLELLAPSPRFFLWEREIKQNRRCDSNSELYYISTPCNKVGLYKALAEGEPLDLVLMDPAPRVVRRVKRDKYPEVVTGWTDDPLLLRIIDDFFDDVAWQHGLPQERHTFLARGGKGRYDIIFSSAPVAAEGGVFFASQLYNAVSRIIAPDMTDTLNLQHLLHRFDAPNSPFRCVPLLRSEFVGGPRDNCLRGVVEGGWWSRPPPLCPDPGELIGGGCQVLLTTMVRGVSRMHLVEQRCSQGKAGVIWYLFWFEDLGRYVQVLQTRGLEEVLEGIRKGGEVKVGIQWGWKCGGGNGMVTGMG